MLTVDEHDLIRRKHLVDGMSLRAISRELGYARNTVAKAVANPIPPGYRLSKPRSKPAIDPVKHIIDAWLEQDEHGHPKQRHTGQRIYERLRDEHNFKGSATAVRRYIRESKQYAQEVYMPLAFEPGEEAQVDWHEGWIEENGIERKARIRTQQPRDKNKLYSLHEPDVQCISKGKAHKRYEFGQKIAVATTNRSNWIVASAMMEGNPYDGHTLSETLTTAERVTGVAVADAYVDQGYRGHGYTGGAEIHIAGQRKKNTTRAERKRRRRRSAIEPKIGHLKSDHRMGRCFLARLCGDAINALLAAAGSNLRKLLGPLRRKAGRFVLALIRWIENQLAASQPNRFIYPAAA